ncbi:MAG: PAS domain-containing sensor histidine kinase [Nocardioidaceae bacterium]|nr:PAS domain-containing sensor histidine kinase [Nocardioidaceae bacterium]
MSGQQTIAGDDLPDGLVVADAAGAVVHLNQAAARLLGTDRDAVIGQPLSEVITLDDLSGCSWYDAMRPYDGLETRTRLVEQAWYRPDGRELLVTGGLVRERPLGAVLRVTVSMRAVRARWQLDRRHSDLVATVAHELRSPLTGVKGFTATLLAKWDRFSDQQRRLMLETVDADADRLARLITELLDTARIDAGRLALRVAPVDVVALSRRVAASITAAGGRDIRLELSAGAPEIWGDADKLSQVLTNLVENAQRHGRGTVAVSVLGEPAADGTPGVAVLVDDEGEGVPEELRERVFNRFWHTGGQDGSGLGLYIVRGLVEAHSGEVAILSSPAGGARIRIWLPVAEPETLAATSVS